MVIAIISESRSASVGNRDRHHLGTLIAIARNTQPTPQRRAESQNLPTVALSVLAPSQARSADCCAPLFNDLDRLPTHLPNLLGVASMVLKFAGRDPSVLLVSEGLGTKKWHGRIVILVNEHTVSAGEMAAGFASENHLATIVGTETAGRLIPGSGFKVGQGYMLIMPKAEYITWQGHRFEGSGVKPDFEVPWSPEAFSAGNDNQLEFALQVVSGLEPHAG